MEEKVLIVRYGEIAMRGNNRKLFVTRLVNAIRKNLDDMGDYYVVREQGRLIVEDRGGEMDFDKEDYELTLEYYNTDNIDEIDNAEIIETDRFWLSEVRD